MTRTLPYLAMLVAATAAADTSSKCRVRAIQALKSGDGIDPKLESLKALLKKAPFDAFKAFKLIDEQLVGVEMGKAASVGLASGTKLKLTLLERIEGKDRTLLRVRVDYTGGSTTVRLGEGDPIPIVFGNKDGSALILAIDCASK